jgi:hypothetical protein
MNALAIDLTFHGNVEAQRAGSPIVTTCDHAPDNAIWSRTAATGHRDPSGSVS